MKAFPLPENCSQGGMELRDYFAAHVASAVAAAGIAGGENGSSPATIAKAAYMLADAMMKAREETKR